MVCSHRARTTAGTARAKNSSREEEFGFEKHLGCGGIRNGATAQRAVSWRTRQPIRERALESQRRLVPPAFENARLPAQQKHGSRGDNGVDWDVRKHPVLPHLPALSRLPSLWPLACPERDHFRSATWQPRNPVGAHEACCRGSQPERLGGRKDLYQLRLRNHPGRRSGFCSDRHGF